MNTRKRKAKALNGHQLEIWPVEQPPQGQTLSGEQPPLFEPPPATAAAQRLADCRPSMALHERQPGRFFGPREPGARTGKRRPGR
jgi:hypothetical protein